jgi:hypothetical protein
MDHPTPTSRLVTPVHCPSLRHKGMYVMAEPDPKEAKFFDAYDATAYWCVHTQRAIGPDGRPVHADSCRQGRSCCNNE